MKSFYQKNRNRPALLGLAVLLLALFALVAAPVASAQGPGEVEIDWDSLPSGDAPVAGLIITNQYGPGTGFAAPFTVSATGGAAGDAVLFDSSNPTGGDVDLGTPNEDFGGPGIGAGGEAGTPGQNDEALGFLLIVEENSTDDNGDGIIDGGAPNAPDDAVGVTISLTFENPVTILSADLIDQEAAEPVTITAFDSNGDVIGTPVDAAGFGDNSYEVIDLGFTDVSELLFEFGGSGGIESILLIPPDVTAISLGGFSSASAAPATGLWIAMAAALLATTFVVLRRRDLLRMVR
jgi:hypothetical protein